MCRGAKPERSRSLELERAYVLESGHMIMRGSSVELAGNKEVQAA